jgi:hypothetical protein
MFFVGTNIKRMASNFVRVQSVESGSFDSRQNRATFVIPGNSGVVSLRDSFMELVARVDYTGAQTQPQPCFLKWSIDDGATGLDNYFPNIALIRNAELRTSRQGTLDSIRRVDVLRSTQKAFEKGCFQLESDDYLSASSTRHPDEQNHLGVFFQGNKLGDVDSRMVDAPLPISLPDMLDICQIDAIDTGKTGDIRIHVEMNLGGAGRSGPTNVSLIDPILADNRNAIADVGDGASGARPFNAISTRAAYPNINASPFYVGQALEFSSATANGGADAIQDEGFHITAISQNADNTLTMSIRKADGTDFPDLAAGAYYTDVTVAGLGASAAAVSFPECRLVYKKVPPMEQMPMMYEYGRYDTIEENGSGIVNYQRGVDIDGSSSEAIIVPIDPANLLLPSGSEWEDWRLRVNNVEMTDRRVLVDSPLYYDRVVSTLLSMGVDVRSAQQDMGAVANDWPGAWGTAAQELIIAGSPLPQTAGPRKNLQLIINCTDGGNGVRSYAVFTHRMVVLDLRGR